MLMSPQTRCVESFPCNLLGQRSAILLFPGGGEWTQGLMYVRPAFYQGLTLSLWCCWNRWGVWTHWCLLSNHQTTLSQLMKLKEYTRTDIKPKEKAPGHRLPHIPHTWESRQTSDGLLEQSRQPLERTLIESIGSAGWRLPLRGSWTGTMATLSTVCRQFMLSSFGVRVRIPGGWMGPFNQWCIISLLWGSIRLSFTWWRWSTAWEMVAFWWALVFGIFKMMKLLFLGVLAKNKRRICDARTLPWAAVRPRYWLYLLSLPWLLSVSPRGLLWATFMCWGVLARSSGPFPGCCMLDLAWGRKNMEIPCFHFVLLRFKVSIWHPWEDWPC